MTEEADTPTPTRLENCRASCRRCLVRFAWKTWLLFVTFICLLFGGLIAIGGILVMVDESFAESIQVEQNLQGIRVGAIIFLVTGLVIMIVNGTGFMGGVLKSPKSLLAYFLLVLLLALLPEAVLIIVSLSRTQHVVELIDRTVRRNLVGYLNDNEDNAQFMINIQSTLQCCGFNGISDYRKEEQRQSCYHDNQFYITGCKNAMRSMFMQNIIIIAIAVVVHLILFVVLGMVSAWKVRGHMLAKSKRRESELNQTKETYVGDENQGLVKGPHSDTTEC